MKTIESNIDDPNVQFITDAIDKNIETIYFNGFTNALGTSDVIITLQKNGKAITILNASYTVAKTLAMKLSEMISALEDRTGQKILTTTQVEECLKK